MSYRLVDDFRWEYFIQTKKGKNKKKNNNNNNNNKTTSRKKLLSASVFKNPETDFFPF